MQYIVICIPQVLRLLNKIVFTFHFYLVLNWHIATYYNSIIIICGFWFWHLLKLHQLRDTIKLQLWSQGLAFFKYHSLIRANNNNRLEQRTAYSRITRFAYGKGMRINLLHSIK